MTIGNMNSYKRLKFIMIFVGVDIEIVFIPNLNVFIFKTIY